MAGLVPAPCPTCIADVQPITNAPATGESFLAMVTFAPVWFQLTVPPGYTREGIRVLNLVSRGLPGNDGALRGGGGRVTFTGETDSVTPLSSTNQGAESTAVVLLSGGLDSTTVLAIAKSEGFAVHALTFRYGQRHSGRSTRRSESRAVRACASIM